jgi:hypothetical protein
MVGQLDWDILGSHDGSCSADIELIGLSASLDQDQK